MLRENVVYELRSERDAIADLERTATRIRATCADCTCCSATADLVRSAALLADVRGTLTANNHDAAGVDLAADEATLYLTRCIRQDLQVWVDAMRETHNEPCAYCADPDTIYVHRH